MTLLTRFFILCALLTVFACQAEQKDSSPIYVGEKVTLASKVLGENRTMMIRRPADYDARQEKHYPVLFVLDGETHFLHASGTVNWLSEQAYRIPHMLVVAVSNTNRVRDMTASYNNGGADSFLAFLRDELIPYVDKHYRTVPFRVLAGHSMAGHFALNAFVQQPELFNGYIAMSPFFNQDWGETQLTDQLHHVLSQKRPGHHFIYASLGDESSLMPKFNTFIASLDTSNDNNLHWKSQVEMTDDHMSTPSNTLNRALMFIFAQQSLSATSETAKQGLHAIRQYFTSISEQIYGYKVSDYLSVSRYAYHLLNTEKKIDEAIKVFSSNVQSHPYNLHAHKDMAYAYNRNKQYAEALQAIERAIKLTSESDSILGYLLRQKQRFEEQLKQS